MINLNAMLLCDTYKCCHVSMFDPGLTELTSYWVPRKSMLGGDSKMVFFGLQAFIQEFLIDYFNTNFFTKSEDTVVEQYEQYLDVQLGRGNYSLDHIVELHQLGYLPLRIKALPEGTKVPMGVPCIEVTNTDSRFAWLVQWVECILQAELWKPCNHATIGDMYYELAVKYYGKTVDDSINPREAFADFGMRGMSCVNEAVRCSAAWLLSANKTSTIPALAYIDKYYAANCAKHNIGRGAVSTEHAVIGANYANGHDEEAFLRRMLTETYPNTSFSFLGDTYDYWNFIDNILPRCKAEILAHNGKLLVRPDSGDMVEIAVKTIQKMWETFGGSVNSKGYKILDPHIGLIYGDGCTLKNVDEVWRQLEELGFAANNIVYGVGAFCFTSFFNDGRLIVNTRDVHGLAMKATHGRFGDKEVMIYKDPKTDQGLKKSHKGLVFVSKFGGDELSFRDGLLQQDYDELADKYEPSMRTVFEDGFMLHFQQFSDIRERLAQSHNK